MPLKVVHAKKWTNSLYNHLQSKVEFVHKKVVGFEVEKNRIVGVETIDGQIHRMDQYVIASGMGSVKIGKTLGL